ARSGAAPARRPAPGWRPAEGPARQRGRHELGLKRRSFKGVVGFAARQAASIQPVSRAFLPPAVFLGLETGSSAYTVRIETPSSAAHRRTAWSRPTLPLYFTTVVSLRAQRGNPATWACRAPAPSSISSQCCRTFAHLIS